MTKKTPEQQAREMLDRMDVDGALEMTAGDVGELAQAIAERNGCKMKLEGLVAHAEDLLDKLNDAAPGAEYIWMGEGERLQSMLLVVRDYLHSIRDRASAALKEES